MKSQEKKRTAAIVSTYLVLRKEDQVLCLLRKNTGYMDGYYGLIAGHIEQNESATEGMIREAYEEAGIHVQEDNLKVVHIIHRKSERLNIDIYFECSKWDGAVQNKEPHKCEALEYFDLYDLPENMIDHVRTVLEYIEEGVFYSELGWKQ